MDVRQVARLQRELEALKRDNAPFPIPLCLMYATQDPMVPPAVGDALSRLIPRASFLRLDRASHFAHVDATDRFIPLALNFLQSSS